MNITVHVRSSGITDRPLRSVDIKKRGMYAPRSAIVVLGTSPHNVVVPWPELPNKPASSPCATPDCSLSESCSLLLPVRPGFSCDVAVTALRVPRVCLRRFEPPSCAYSPLLPRTGSFRHDTASYEHWK